jgi:tetratricopeptide (TPR) repeat protein
MSSQPENEQTALENVTAGGDINANISQEINHEPNKLADKIGVVAQANSKVNIDTLNVGGNTTVNYTQIIQEAKRAGSLINLPQTNVTFFAGRDQDLEKVHSLFQQNQRVAVSAYVKGMGGVGKTELTIQYALRHLLSDYRGGICWLQANGNLAIQLQDFVRVQLAKAIPDDLGTAENLAAYCWRCLTEHLSSEPATPADPQKMLVILDDVKDYEALKPYLPSMGGNFTVLATTRLELGGAMQQHRLDILEISAAEALLLSFLPMDDLRRTSSEIKTRCEWLGRLPLAIELVGRYLALPNQLDTGIPKILQRLQTECMVQLSEITDEERKLLPKNLNVAASFFLSWQELSPLAQRLACLLGLFALAPIHWTLVEATMLVEIDTEQSFWQGWKGARGELLNLHLLERTQQGVYELHQLLQEYFQFQLQQHPEWLKLRQQVALSLLTISKSIGQTITQEQVKEISPSIPHLEILGSELLDHIPNPEDDLIGAFIGIARFHEGQGLYASALVPYQNCLKATELHLGADHPSVATSLNNLAGLYYSQGKYSKAEPLYLRSLEIRERQLGADHPSVATSLNNLAGLYRSQGKYSKAEPLYLRAIQIFENVLGSEHPNTVTVRQNYEIMCKER